MHSKLQNKIDTFIETGKGKVEVLIFYKEVENASDQILEKYLDVFLDKNPSLAPIKLDKHRIEGFKSGYGIYTIAPLPNGDILIGGYNGALYEYQKQSNDSYKLSNLIKGFNDENGNGVNIMSIASLQNDRALIGGWHDTLYEAHTPRSLETLKRSLDKITKR